MMSMSLTESAQRRSEPAASTRSAAGCARSASTTWSAVSIARESTTLRAGPSSSTSASTRRRFSSALRPNPRRPRRRPSSTAARSASSESTPISSCSRFARLGPNPGRCMTEMRPTGIRSRNFTSVGMSPVSSSASTFSSSVLPIPGRSVMRPSRASCATDTEVSRTVRAALR